MPNGMLLIFSLPFLRRISSRPVVVLALPVYPSDRSIEKAKPATATGICVTRPTPTPTPGYLGPEPSC
jgi:hypothetical protein